MDKNWLIRTKSNHILGPISKEKVLELYNNGSIKPDDEIASGNGFWFFVREDDMVKKYLLGNAVQGFNPISEAKDVLTGHHQGPSVEPDDITLVNGIDLKVLDSESVPATPPESIQDSQSLPESKEASVVEIKKKNNLDTKVKHQAPKSSVTKPLKKQSYLKYLGIVGFIVLFFLIYFRKTIIQNLFQGEMTFSPTISLIDSAQAQEVIPAKKKSF